MSNEQINTNISAKFGTRQLDRQADVGLLQSNVSGTAVHNSKYRFESEKSVNDEDCGEARRT